MKTKNIEAETKKLENKNNLLFKLCFLLMLLKDNIINKI